MPDSIKGRFRQQQGLSGGSRLREVNPYAAEVPPLDCREFIERHSEYLDGQLSPDDWVEFDDHVARCAACERYDRVVRRGLLLLRNTTEVQPSEDFHERLEARLRSAEVESRMPMVADSRTVVMVAAVLALVGLTPMVPLLLRDSKPVVEAMAAEPVAERFDRAPWNFAPNTGLMLTPGPNAATLTASGPFTPLIVQAPVVSMQPSAPQITPWPVLMINNR